MTTARTTKTAWTSSRLNGSPDPPLLMRAERIYKNLQFDQPVAVRDLSSLDRRMVLTRAGQIVSFAADPARADDTLLAIDLDVSFAQPAGEQFQAARDLEVDPQFDKNGYVYVMWSVKPLLTPGGARITRLTIDRHTLQADPASRIDLITYPSGDHIGASVRFGPDGFLYVTTGDGARPFPPDEYRTAQDLSNLRGSVLRVDVSDATAEYPYQIPPDNPFVDRNGARGEIYAFGIRNGFRSTFHPVDGSLWVADVGWERCEMIHRIERGGNHGWSLREGPYPVNMDQVPGPGAIIPPFIVMARNRAQSITGGPFIPANSRLAEAAPSLAGRLLFGCYMNGKVWAADVSDPLAVAIDLIAETGLRLVDFRVSRLPDTPADKTELLALDIGGGGLYRLIPNDRGGASQDFPRRLSETGLYEDLATMTPAAGVVAYQPAATMYRGGAIGNRLIAWPGSKPLDFSRSVQYPEGTALANTLWRDVMILDGTSRWSRIETQILLYDGLNWDPYTYRWDDDQLNATLVSSDGEHRELTVADKRFGSVRIEHRFASRSTCLTCHHAFNAGPMTFNATNLSGQPGPSPMLATAAAYTDWDKLVSDGYVIGPKSGTGIPMAAADDSTVDLTVRARSYLHMNCSACHRLAGGAITDLNLQYHLPDDRMQAIDATPLHGSFGLSDPSIVHAGVPQRSVLMYRLATAGPGHMPQVTGQAPDIEGGLLIWQWIASLPEDELQMTNPVKDSRQGPAATQSTTDALLGWHQLAAAKDAQVDPALFADQPVSSSVLVAGLYEGLLPPARPKVYVGDTPDREKLLSITGDPTRGRRWYRQSAASQCRNCHGGGSEKENDATSLRMGPSLNGISKRMNNAALLDSILDPSAKVDPVWALHQIVTVEGETIVGLLKSTEEDSITLQCVDGRMVTIDLDDIELRLVMEQSLMPAGMLSSLPPQQVADLIAYLNSI